LFTTNGKEYVTPKQLHNEVEDEILTHGGRVNITDLPAILNVDLPHIERAVQELLAKDGDLQMINGELITSYYCDSLAEEINGALQAAGKGTLGDLAIQHNLSTEFVQRLVEARLGVVIEAKLSGGTLYTAAYVSRHTARVRGVLSALTRPVSLPQLIRTYGFNETLFHDAICELHTSGRLMGTLQGKTSFTPAVHLTLQMATVNAFFRQNGVIEYEALAKMQLKDPRAYLQAEHPDGVPLSSCYMAREQLTNVEAELEEVCNSGGTLELRSCVAFSLTDSDLDSIVSASAALSAAVASKRVIRLNSALFASAQLVQCCTDMLEGFAQERVKGMQQVRVTSVSTTLQQPSAGGKGRAAAKAVEEEVDGKKVSKGKAKKAAKRDELLASVLAGDELDEEDDLDEPSSKKKGKKGKAKRSGGGGGGGGSGDMCWRGGGLCVLGALGLAFRTSPEVAQ